MSGGLEVIVKIAASIFGGGFLLLLTAAIAWGCRRETKRWKEEGVAKVRVRRLSLSMGQPVEVEYQLVPESKEFAAGVEINRVLAYNGAVAVDVAPLLREHVPSLMEEFVDRCHAAEYGGREIPFC